MELRLRSILLGASSNDNHNQHTFDVMYPTIENFIGRSKRFWKRR